MRALGRFVEQGMVYKGKKPVHWCMHCRTALAEAEVEYEPHTSPSIYVEFPLADEQPRRAGAPGPGAGGSQCLGPDLDDDAVDDPVESRGRIPSRISSTARIRCDGTTVIVAKDLAEAWRPRRTHVRRAARDVPRAARWSGWCSVIRSTPATRSRSLGDYVTLEAGTGVVHTAPGHGADDYHTGVKYGLDIYGPLDAGGHFLDTVELFAGLQVFDAESEDRSGARRARAPLASGELRALVSALLALPQPGDLSRDLAVVHRDGRAGPARAGAQGDRRHALDSGVGSRADLQHDRASSRLVHLAPAGLGRADPGRRLQGVRASRC